MFEELYFQWGGLSKRQRVGWTLLFLVVLLLLVFGVAGREL